MYTKPESLPPRPGTPPVEPTPTPTPTPTLPPPPPPVMFVDIDGHWAYDNIVSCFYAGLVEGKGNGIFDPDGTFTRAEAAMIAYRIAPTKAMPTDKPIPTFMDVSPGTWYEAAIQWAVSWGLINPFVTTIGDETALRFHPDEPITREDTVIMLGRMVEQYYSEATQTKPKMTFPDIDMTKIEFQTYISELSGHGVINGYPDGTFRPNGKLTRAELATVVFRFLQVYGEAGKSNYLKQINLNYHHKNYFRLRRIRSFS